MSGDPVIIWPGPLQVVHTEKHINCPGCERIRRQTMLPKITPDLTFCRASEIWLESRVFRDGAGRGRYVASSTLKSYEQYVRSLNRFFSDIPLNEIHAGHLRGFQEIRASGQLGEPDDQVLARVAKQQKTTIEKLRTEEKYKNLAAEKLAAARIEVSPNKINQEVATLIRILRRAGCWNPELEESYETLLHEEADIPRAMTPVEQEFFLEVAASRQEWQFVYWYALVALRTTMTNYEMRGLRLGDLNLASGLIYVQPGHAKNRYRVRTIPLAPDALWAAQRLVERAHELASNEPQHFVMPFRVARGLFDPTRPMSNSGIKKPWEALRTAAGLPWLRIHDLRHTAITRLAEAGTPIPVVMSMAGHISRRMMQHYTQISEQAQRTAVMAAYNQTYYDPKKKKEPGNQKRVDNRITVGVQSRSC